MEIKKIKLELLKTADRFLLSFPLKPGLYNELGERLGHLPLIIINKENEILFGIDYYHFLVLKNTAAADVIQMDIPDKEALILNYNLKDKFTGLNLYEKLVFIKRIMPLAETTEIYQKTGLDTGIGPELLNKLDLLLSTCFRGSFTEETINLKTGLRLCDFQPDDREELLELFAKIPFSSSHQLKILEMAEEVLFRDKCTIEEIFDKLAIEKYFNLEKPQKKIIDALFKHRNPIYIETEKKWQEEIQSLNLPHNIKVSHYPFFEKNHLELTVHLQNTGELKNLLKKINQPNGIDEKK